LDVKLVNPFIASFNHVMKSLGFIDILTRGIAVKSGATKCNGVVLVVGLVGDLKGTIVFSMQEEVALRIASKLMMGAPVAELDEMARSSICELSNMLSAHAATGLTEQGHAVDISPPNIMQGDNMRITMASEKTISIEVSADGLILQMNIAIGRE